MNIEDYVLFIGMDPAIISDYFGICVHALPAIIPTDKPWMPLLIKLTTLQKGNYDTTWEELNNGILSKYKNFKALNIDYTNEKTLADFLEEKYGENRILKTPFTKGESGTKMQMAQSAKKLLDNGYSFPDHNKIEDPIERNNIRTLKQQIINEQIIINPDGSIKFQHKGKHNDLLHAWMLSLDVTMQYMINRLGKSEYIVAGPIRRKLPRTLADYKLQLNKRGLSAFDV